MPSHTVDKYSSDENHTSESDRYMTTPEPGAPDPGLRLADAGPGASRGGGQGTFGYGVGMASSDTTGEDEDEDMTSPDNSDEREDGDEDMTSPDNSDEGEDGDEDMASSDNSDEDGDGDINMTSPDNSDEDEGGDIDMTFFAATEVTGNYQYEGHAGSVAGSVMEIDSDHEDMEIDENGGVYGRKRTHANRGNIEQWLNGTYAVGYGPPRNAQEEMQHFDRDFGIFGL